METTQVDQAHTPRVRTTLDLDALAKLDGPSLERLYAGAPAPTDLALLEGLPRGRMLAVRGLDRGVAAGAIQRLAAAAFFPWGGKSFRGRGAEGRGINRVHLFGRHQVFPFLTRIAPSALDGAPSVVLDYDLPDNPSLVRRIHDEVREIEPGLYLGPAMWKTDGEPKAVVLWFALDTRIQAKPIGEKH